MLVFARAPAPGRCKTRLIPALGAAGAARLHRQLLRRTLRSAVASGLPVELWCAPDASHGEFRALRRESGVSLRRQPAGDLGRRMALALRGRTAVLVGTDCPSLRPGDIAAAARALGAADAALIPSLDGGYVLIGARSLPRRALAGIAWSSGRELAQTRRRMDRLGLGRREQAPLADLDTPADLRRARRNGLLGDLSQATESTAFFRPSFPRAQKPDK